MMMMRALIVSAIAIAVESSGPMIPKIGQNNTVKRRGTVDNHVTWMYTTTYAGSVRFEVPDVSQISVGDDLELDMRNQEKLIQFEIATVAAVTVAGSLSSDGTPEGTVTLQAPLRYMHPSGTPVGVVAKAACATKFELSTADYNEALKVDPANAKLLKSSNQLLYGKMTACNAGQTVETKVTCATDTCDATTDKAACCVDDPNWDGIVTLTSTKDDQDLDCSDHGTCDAGCFPGDAQVELQNGTEVTMSALKIGDSVRVGPSEFSEIFLFGHRDAGVKANVFKISTSTGKAIRLTGGHYLYVNGQLQTARAVKLGDMVSSGRVTAIDQEWADGLYNPHTMTGDIVVDGVLTSTYTEAVAPSVAHGLLWPVRMLYNVGLLQLAGDYSNITINYYLAGTFEIDGWFRSSGLILVSKLGLTGKAKEIKKY